MLGLVDVLQCSMLLLLLLPAPAAAGRTAIHNRNLNLGDAACFLAADAIKYTPSILALTTLSKEDNDEQTRENIRSYRSEYLDYMIAEANEIGDERATFFKEEQTDKNLETTAAVFFRLNLLREYRAFLDSFVKQNLQKVRLFDWLVVYNTIVASHVEMCIVRVNKGSKSAEEVDGGCEHKDMRVAMITRPEAEAVLTTYLANKGDTTVYWLAVQRHKTLTWTYGNAKLTYAKHKLQTSKARRSVHYNTTTKTLDWIAHSGGGKRRPYLCMAVRAYNLWGGKNSMKEIARKKISNTASEFRTGGAYIAGNAVKQP